MKSKPYTVKAFFSGQATQFGFDSVEEALEFGNNCVESRPDGTVFVGVFGPRGRIWTYEVGFNKKEYTQ